MVIREGLRNRRNETSGGSALALFVARVGTDHPDYAFAANDLAVFAKFFY
jgi:hypothetical protein